MVHHTIHKLRQRPHHEKHRIAVGGALTVMVVLFVGWLGFSVHSIYATAGETANGVAAAASSISDTITVHSVGQ